MKEVPVTKRRGRVLQTIGYFTLGAATGGIIALLFAPASGRVTRRRIAQKLRSVQRSAARRLSRTQRLLAKKAALVGQAATQKFSQAREWMAGHTTNGQSKRPIRHRAVHHV